MDKRPFLTVREQEFYFFLRRQPKIPRQCDIARAMGIPRQRVHQLMTRLKEKGYFENGGSGRKSK
jgi:DNA-binding IclR family transcriptional regulator